MKRSTVKKILLGLTAFSLFVTPAQASEITDRDGNPLINPDESIHNLYAQSIDGNTARSTYDKFTLDADQIANMHFNVEGGSVFATDLINFVNNRIDINGTVNAIRNGAIDGNLYFLSPEGIAIGKTGVINAGGFTAQSDGGSVDIKGTVNARNNISLIGQSITVDGATLNAQSDINFSSLVNAGDTVNNIANLRMTVDPSGNGDIIIRAESTTTLDVTGAGVNANAINDTTQTVIKNSTLNASGDITVESKAARSFTASATAGGSVNVQAIMINAGVNANAINDTTQTVIKNSTLNASGDLTVESKAARSFTASAINDGSVNVQAIMINAGVGDLDSAYAQKLINESGYEAPASTGGVLTDISSSTLTAGRNVKINTIEQNNATLVNGSQNTIGATVVAINHNAKTLLTSSTVNGATVEIGAIQSGDGINSTVNEVGAGMAEIGIGYNSVRRSGETLVNVRGSNITASEGDIDIRAEDNLSVNLLNAAVQTAVVGTPSTVGKSTNNASARVLIESFARTADNLNAAGDINVGAVNGSSANVNVVGAGSNDTASTNAAAVDNGLATVTIADTGHKFSGESINLSSTYDPATVANIPSVYQSNGRTKMNATAELGGGASVEVSNANTFDAPIVNYSAISGSLARIGADAQMRALNGTDDPNAAVVNTATKTTVKIGSENYSEGAAVNVESASDIGRHAYVNGYSIVLSSGAVGAIVNADDKITASSGVDNGIEQKVGSLTVNASGGGITNLKATGGTGITGNYAKSTVENRSDITVSASVGGWWTVDDAITINATSDDTANAYAQQGHNENGADIAASNTLGGSTTASIDKGAVLNAQSVDISARSNFNVGEYNGEELYTLVNYFGRQLNADITSALTVDKKTSVELNGTVETSGAQSYTAVSEGDLLNAITTTGDMNVGINDISANVDSAVAVDNKIRVAADASLKSAGDMTLRAIDFLALDSNSLGNGDSFSAGLISNINTTLDRTNLVDVKGTVEAGGVVNVDAGSTRDNLIPIAVNITSDINSRWSGIFFGSNQNAYYDLTENNSITVNGSIRGADDVNLRAEGGLVDLRYSNKQRGSDLLFYWSNPLTRGNGKKINAVTVNGTVQAGVATDDINISISGKVVPSAFNISGTDGSGTLTVTSNIDVDYTEGDEEYGKELVARLNALNVLIDQYYTGAQSDVNTAAVAGYVAERERVIQKLRDLGLMTTEGQNESAQAEGVDIRYVEIGNLSSIGGNLNLNTSTVNGSGTLKTAGAPNVNITNTSNAYLILNDVKRASNVGNINLNGKARYSGDPSFASTLKIASAAEKGAGKISIRNDPDNSAVNVTAKTDGAASSYTPHPDMLVQGSIENFYGDISIVNTKGDIDIATDANVSGRNVLIESAGTLNQGYVDGMLNISKSLEDIYVKETDGKAEAARSHINPLLASDKYEQVIATDIDGGTNEGRISGSNIYIAAQDININGIIQSGYDSYFIDVNPSDIQNGRYVGKSGAVYNDYRGWYYYYVPITVEDGRLIADDIETGGGQIYISGRIASTGNGKILAANGFADIDIKNNTDLPIELGKVINNYRSGKITIVDTGNDTWTEYTPGQTRYINNYAQMLKEHFADGMLNDAIQTTSNTLYAQHINYQPAAGMRYNWTDGSGERTTSRIRHEGIRFIYTPINDPVLDSDVWNEYMRTVTPDAQTVENADLEAGAFLSLNNSTDKADNNLRLTAESERLYYSYAKQKSGFLGSKIDWDYRLQTLQTYTFNVNASRPIELGFLNKDAAGAPIYITSNGDVHFTGDVNVGGDTTRLTVLVNNGGITQDEGTALRTNDAYLYARDDISGVNIESLGVINKGGYTDEVILYARSAGGDIDINVSGGIRDGRALPGNVHFTPIKSQSSDGSARGNVTLTATGNITGSVGVLGSLALYFGNPADIIAKDVKLTSRNGAVGAYGKAMYIDASGVADVVANHDVAVSSGYNATLNIGQLTSENGTVYVNTWGDDGKIQQSATYQHDVEEVDTEKQIHAWIDAGLIAPTADYEGAYVGKLKAAVDNYASEIGGEYQTYTAGKADYETLKSTVATEYQEYLSIKDGYQDRVDEVDEVFEEYLMDSQQLRNSLESEYARMQQYRGTQFLTDSQQKTLKRLETKFSGYDSAEAYYIVNAADELDNEDYLPFIGYNDIDAYMASTPEGRLMNKYSAFDSADAYLQTTQGYALEQKYGAYSTLEAFLNTDEKYKELVAARDNVTFPNTLEAMLNQAALEQEADSYNIKSAHLYIDNKKLR